MVALSVEEQFYLVWPLATILLLGLRQRLSTVVVVLVTAIVFVVAYRMWLFENGTGVLVLYTRTINRADTLLIGALLAHLWVRGKVPHGRGVSLAGWGALTFFGYVVWNGGSDDFHYTWGFFAVAVSVAVMLLAVLESEWAFRRVLELRPLRLIGRVSYGLYIWHFGVFRAVARYGGDWPDVGESVRRLQPGRSIVCGVVALRGTAVPALEGPDRRSRASIRRPRSREGGPGEARALRDEDRPHPLNPRHSA